MSNLQSLINLYNVNTSKQKLISKAQMIYDPDHKYKNSMVLAQLTVKVLYTFQRGGNICSKEYRSRLFSQMDLAGIGVLRDV